MHSENKIKSDETVIVGTVNKHFVNTTNKLKLQPTQTEKEELTLSETLDRNKYHPSIIKIWCKMNEQKI